MADDDWSNIVGEWHKGEKHIQSVLHVPPRDNPTSPFLPRLYAKILENAPLLAIGTLDSKNRPWTSLWSGEPGFARSLGPSSMVGVKAIVDSKYDPVVEALLGGRHAEKVEQEEGAGRIVSGLGVNLHGRSRVKLSGRMVVGALEPVESGSEGNCPKYLNKRQIIPSLPNPKLISDSLPLPDEAVNLLANADLFFMSSSDQDTNMGTNHRGGSPGFVRLAKNDSSGVTLVYPEYTGNNFYQSLGNLHTTPMAGLAFPDLDTGDILYITGRSKILFGKDAAAVITRSNVAVKIDVLAARFVQKGLAFRSKAEEPSPYNPPVRYLTSERQARLAPTKDSNQRAFAKLIQKDVLTSTVVRLRFSITNPAGPIRWKPGQYVALALEEELSKGYLHLDEENPQSLNDDYVRTFTVSSIQGDLPEDQFEITLRNVGHATKFLYQYNLRAGLELPLLGFGGEFVIKQAQDESVSFVAGGIGITPVLGQISDLNLDHLVLHWTVNIMDIGLVHDTFKRIPKLAGSTHVYISGNSREVSGKDAAALEKVQGSGAKIELRRLSSGDLRDDGNDKRNGGSSRWYICAGKGLRQELLKWLEGKEVVYEDFGY